MLNTLELDVELGFLFEFLEPQGGLRLFSEN